MKNEIILNFEIDHFPFLDGDVPRSPFYMVYTLIRLCSNVEDFNRNECLTSKLLRQGNRYHKLRKAFLNFITDLYSELITKYNICLKTLL